MEQEYIEALRAHMRTLSPRDALELYNGIYNCWLDHEKLVLALAGELRTTEHDFEPGAN